MPAARTPIGTSPDNYATMRENKADAEIELERPVERRFAARIARRRAKARFPKGHNNRAAIIAKEVLAAGSCRWRG